MDVFLERAQQFARVRDLTRDDAEFASATALLSVHSAIALNDALLLKLTGRRAAGENHALAARETEKRCKARHLDASGVTQLTTLISAKSGVSYGDHPVTFKFALKLAVASIRFEAWVYARLKEIA